MPFTIVARQVIVGQDGGEVVLDARDGKKITATVNGAAGTGMIGTALGTRDGSAFTSRHDEVYVVPADTPGLVYTAVQFVRNVPGSATCGPDTEAPCAIARTRS